MMELPMLRTCGGNISAVTTYCSTFAVQPIAKVDIHEYTVYLRLRIKVQFFIWIQGPGFNSFFLVLCTIYEIFGHFVEWGRGEQAAQAVPDPGFKTLVLKRGGWG